MIGFDPAVLCRWRRTPSGVRGFTSAVLQVINGDRQPPRGSEHRRSEEEAHSSVAEEQVSVSGDSSHDCKVVMLLRYVCNDKFAPSV